MTIFLQGFFLQASLILALGAQNIFVLNSGLRRQKHLLVAFVSSVCDTALIFIGVLGVATIFVQIPLLKIAFGVLGVIFLAYYGILKLKEARSISAFKDETKSPIDTKQIVLTTLAFSLFNPHVYLDTVVLIGGYSAKFPVADERLLFGLGASSFSVLWFYGLAVFASFGNKFIHNERGMRIISLFSGILLIILAVKLSLDIKAWL